MRAVPASVHEAGELSTTPFLREDNDGLLPGLMRRDINSLFGRMDSLSRRLCGREMAHALVSFSYCGSKERPAMEKLVEKLRIMLPKSAPLTQAAIRRMIKESVDAAIATERARHANAGNDARGSGLVRSQDAAPVVRECTFAGFIKCNPTAFHGTEGAVELRRCFEKTKSVFGISECVEGKKVKFAAAALQGHALTWWNAKVATMGCYLL
ncbi:hypothetical protein Tco_1097228 [Tanacetum coccineum]